MAKLTKIQARIRRHQRLRKKVNGTSECPRMCVFVSNKNMYVQLIDDNAGHTITSATTLSAEFKAAGGKSDVTGAGILGKIAADKAVAAGISTVVFDRGGFKYHGKVKAIADSARKNGLKL